MAEIAYLYAAIMELKKQGSKNTRTEKILFFLVCICNALPILITSCFPTVDGPAHIYNAHLLQQYLSGDSLAETFHQLNPVLVPNWTATVLLLVLRSFLPVFIVEKTMAAIYIIGLPLAFRKLLKSIQVTASIPWLIFPFTYTFMVFMGFYNFNLGVIFFLLALAFWIRIYEKPKPVHFVVLFIYGTLLYFSHIFVFAAYIVCISVYTIHNYLVNNNKSDFKKKLTKTALLFLTLIPWMVLILVFIVTKSGDAKNYMSARSLILQIRSMSLLITFNYKDVENFTKTIFYTIFCLCFFIGIFRVIKHKQNGWFYKSDIWLFISVLFLLIYFVLPDSDGSSGFMSVRIALMFFIFLVLWISMQPVPKWVKILAPAPVIIMHILLLNYYVHKLKEYNSVIAEIPAITQLVGDHKILLPVNNLNEWYLGHCSNYIGAGKDVIILENYECDTRYFPLIWNKGKIPSLMLGDATNKSLSVSWISNNTNPAQKIDYILFIGSDNTIELNTIKEIQNNLDKYYTRIYNTENFQLYSIR